MRYYATLKAIRFPGSHGDVVLPEGHLVRSPGRVPRRYRRLPYSALIPVVFRCAVAWVAPSEITLVAEGPFRSPQES